MKILFWDIDGTLLRSGKAGLFAFAQATKEIWNAQADFSMIKTAGRTDNYIAAEIIRSITGREAEPVEIAALVHRYVELLPFHLKLRQGGLAPSVQDILAYFHNRQGYVSLLLTGNVHSGAKAKLTHYGIADYFDFSVSAFAGNHLHRSDIATEAWTRVQQHFPQTPPDNIFVIGDTPHDISCGKHIGARTIAVATGSYSLEELAAHDPWWAVDSLPSPAEFERRLIEAGK